jgi:hypothetical protein
VTRRIDCRDRRRSPSLASMAERVALARAACGLSRSGQSLFRSALHRRRWRSRAGRAGGGDPSRTADGRRLPAVPATRRAVQPLAAPMSDFHGLIAEPSLDLAGWISPTSCGPWADVACAVQWLGRRRRRAMAPCLPVTRHGRRPFSGVRGLSGRAGPRAVPEGQASGGVRALERDHGAGAVRRSARPSTREQLELVIDREARPDPPAPISTTSSPVAGPPDLLQDG